MPDQTPENMETAKHYVKLVDVALGKGDYLIAYDSAVRGREAFPDDLLLKHRLILTLARSGDFSQAERLLHEFGLAGHADENIAALQARLLRDRAWKEKQGFDPILVRQAAHLYCEIYHRTGGGYSGINGATLSLLSGSPDRARSMAMEVLTVTAQMGVNDYYHFATQAEALLLLGRCPEAIAALTQAAALVDDRAALAGTRRQLRWVCEYLGLDAVTILEPIRAGAVMHYTGHMIAAPGADGRFPPAAEPMVARQIQALLVDLNISIGYGALAGGADILIAEALLDRRGELHVVLPLETEAFIRYSVRPSGSEWVARCRACLARAASVSATTDHTEDESPEIFALSSRIAMGLAMHKARSLDAPIQQVAVWDGVQTGRIAGTSADVAGWSKKGLPCSIIAPGSTAPIPLPAAPTAVQPQSELRCVRAILFGDVKGFSKLSEPQLPLFIKHVLKRLAKITQRYEKDIELSNTWGDGFFLVFEQVEAAAACALALQDTMKQVDFLPLGLPDYISLRIGGHVGPVFSCVDPMTGRPNIYGSHVTRTARIEPIAPPGSVFVTESFAACLNFTANEEFSCSYCGVIATAKGYGEMRSYLLRSA